MADGSERDEKRDVHAILAAAREEAFIQGDTFQVLTWARVVGGALFVLGGVLPLAWFFLSRLGSLRTARP